MKKVASAIVLTLSLVLIAGMASGLGTNASNAPDERKILCPPRDYFNMMPATNEDGTINVVVEIPAGTTAKWQVAKQDGQLEWELMDGKPRIVQYLGYPVNYGMIPRTLSPKDQGGDGDPLDMVILGDAMPRGSTLAVKVIGVLRLLENGEIDDKILCVRPESPLGKLSRVEELDRLLPGATTILKTWFENYKGKNRLQAKGYGDVREAYQRIHWAMEGYQRLAGPGTPVQREMSGSTSVCHEWRAQ